MSAATLTPSFSNSGTITSRPPLPKSLFTKMTATDFALSVSLMYAATLGMATACVNDVRNTYGLPCCVMDAASPPMTFVISARFVSFIDTTIEPENTGPITT